MLIKKGNLAQEAKEKELDLKTSLIQEETDEDLKINLLIRNGFDDYPGYSLSKEMSLHRKKLMGTIDDNEWNAYAVYIALCIKKVRENNGQ